MKAMKQMKAIVCAAGALAAGTIFAGGTDELQFLLDGKYVWEDEPAWSNRTVAKHPVLRASAYAGMLFNGMGRPIDLNRPCQTLPASMGGNKTPFIDTRLLHDPYAENWIEELHKKAMAGKRIDDQSVPSFIRRITVSEAAALQGFPPDFVFKGSQCDKYRQIGNSVPPPFAHHIAKAVYSLLKGEER